MDKYAFFNQKTPPSDMSPQNTQQTTENSNSSHDNDEELARKLQEELKDLYNGTGY